MKLQNDFFRVKECCPTASGYDYTITLNAEHSIYQAHFPGNPITPGVCIIQIIKELSESFLNRSLFLKKLNNVKFLNVLNPLDNNEVTFSITIASEGDDGHKINAVVSNENGTFAKLSLLFVCVGNLSN